MSTRTSSADDLSTYLPAPTDDTNDVLDFFQAGGITNNTPFDLPTLWDTSEHASSFSSWTTTLPTESFFAASPSPATPPQQHPSFLQDVNLPLATSTQPTHPAQTLKRKASAVDDEEDARMSMEEDKRRRNTAASARFRVKKKAREEEVKRTADEMKRRCETLEGRVKELELENSVLKELVLKKGSADA